MNTQVFYIKTLLVHAYTGNEVMWKNSQFFNTNIIFNKSLPPIINEVEKRA